LKYTRANKKSDENASRATESFSDVPTERDSLNINPISPSLEMAPSQQAKQSEKCIRQCLRMCPKYTLSCKKNQCQNIKDLWTRPKAIFDETNIQILIDL
jgi:hypothetical protein